MIIIEHNLDIIKSADWVIDMGPEGGERGGTVVAFGTPEDIAKNKNSFTGEFLKNELPKI
jgi:excinuclease ABC subunit A